MRGLDTVPRIEVALTREHRTPLPRAGERAAQRGAVEAIRALTETILPEPDGDKLKITVKDDLPGMLSAARDRKRSPETGDLSLQVVMVAGLATG